MSTWCSKHVERWNKYKKKCIELVIRKNLWRYAQSIKYKILCLSLAHLNWNKETVCANTSEWQVETGRKYTWSHCDMNIASQWGKLCVSSRSYRSSSWNFIVTRCECTCVFTMCSWEQISYMPTHIICGEGNLTLKSVDRPTGCTEFGSQWLSAIQAVEFFDCPPLLVSFYIRVFSWHWSKYYLYICLPHKMGPWVA
jgi:hypothetical protein